MNVAIVLMKYNPYGGYERQAALITDALVERGDAVTVFASEWKGDPIETAKGLKGSLVFHKVPVVRISSWLKVLTFALRSRREIENSLTEFDVIVAFDRSLKMDIYRVGNACHKEWLDFRKKHNGFSDSLSVATNMLHRVINTIEESIFKGVNRGDIKAVVLSKSGKEQIESFYGAAEKPDSFVIIPPAINLERLNGSSRPRAKVRAELGIEESTLLLLHVGSGFKIKGLKSTIGALAELVKRGVDAGLIIAGQDKKETSRLKALCIKLKIDKRVRFLGGVTDVAELYGAADIFVLPSLFETFGIAFMEALYMGLPVIVGRGAGAATLIEEAIKSGKNIGKVVDVPAEPSVLADRIVEVAKAEQVFLQNGTIELEKRGRKDVALICAPEKVIVKFIAEIDEAAKRKQAVKG